MSEHKAEKHAPHDKPAIDEYEQGWVTVDEPSAPGADGQVHTVTVTKLGWVKKAKAAATE